MKRCIPSGNLTFSVGYLLCPLIICMCQMECHEKQDDLTYNVGYLPSIGEY